MSQSKRRPLGTPALHLIRNIEVPSFTDIGLQGWFTVELIHARTGLVKRRLEFKNLITDAALNAMAETTSADQLTSYMAVGTGTTAPAVTDVALVSEAGRTNNNGGFGLAVGWDSVGQYRYFRLVRLFTETQGNGNLTELGLFRSTYGAVGDTMLTRQLFRDELGNPTTITKTSADQLRVTYELRVHAGASAAVTSFTVNGTVHNITTQRHNSNDAYAFAALTLGGVGNLAGNKGFGCRIGATNVIPASVATNIAEDGFGPNTRELLGTYAAGTFYRDVESRWEPSGGNLAGGLIGNVLNFAPYSPNHGGSVYYAYASYIDPKVPKDNTQRFIWQDRISLVRV